MYYVVYKYIIRCGRVDKRDENVWPEFILSMINSIIYEVLRVQISGGLKVWEIDRAVCEDIVKMLLVKWGPCCASHALTRHSAISWNTWRWLGSLFSYFKLLNFRLKLNLNQSSKIVNCQLKMYPMRLPLLARKMKYGYKKPASNVMTFSQS